ncbi:DUF2851 family protein [Lutibacter sp.]
MKEDFLVYIWKLKLFLVNELATTEGEKIVIKSVGVENLNSGPDFFNAKIKIGNQLWAGNVEIHVNSSDWYVHNHEQDKRYDTVILHVVWEHDVTVFRSNNQPVVTLELKKYVSKSVLTNYTKLFKGRKNWINCEQLFSSADSFVMNHWLERLYFERLEQKTIVIEQLLKTYTNDWEAVLFILVAKNFGLTVNAEAFMNFAKSLDFSVVRKQSANILSLEALFLGQSGLLSKNYESDYFKTLQSEYRYLKIKFNLQSIKENQIQFFRLRPTNFPTIRLSQLAMLYHKHQNLVSKIVAARCLEDYYVLFQIAATSYWKNHYTFDKISKKSDKRLTKAFIDLLLINVIFPFQFLYYRKSGISKSLAIMNYMKQLNPEKNAIISKFSALGFRSSNAFESQALLQLKKEYCSKLNCLHCEIGKTLLSVV